MRNCHKNKGSVLVLVIGMLTILFMLGVTFLAVTHLNARQADALQNASPVDPLAQGIVARVASALRDSRAVAVTPFGPGGNIGPYGMYKDPATGNPQTGSAAWVKFINYPSAQVNPWLSSNWTDDATFGAYAQRMSDLGFTGTGASTTVTGDVQDAQWYPSGVFNSRGDQFYVAARVIDLGGLLCLNTGGDGVVTAPDTTCIYPAWVDIKDHLNQSLLPSVPASNYYTTLFSARGELPATTTDSFSTGSARKLLATDPAFLPFSIADESCLRWVGAASVQTGRLYSVLSGKAATPPLAAAMPVKDMRQLTTFNCTSNITRYPSANLPTRLCLQPPAAGTALDDDGVRQRLYSTLMYMMGDPKTVDQPTADRHKKFASHYVANLWAYMRRKDPKTQAFKFTPNDKLTDNSTTWSVYGQIEQPVISEVYGNEALDPTGKSLGTAYAIELFNPTNKDITISDYQLKVGGTPFTFTAGLVIPKSGGRVVLWMANGNLFAADGITPTPADAVAFPNKGTPPAGVTWLDGSAVLGSLPGGTVQLMRRLPTEDIQVDSVDTNWTTGAAAKANAKNNPFGASRDDDLNRQKVTVNVYVKTTTDANHLGLAPNVPKGVVVASVDEGFSINFPHATPTSASELASVYWVGPEIEKNPGGVTTKVDDFPNQLGSTFVGFQSDHSRGRPDLRGAAGNFAIPANGWPAPVPAPVNDLGNRYPDVPFACLLNEIINVTAADGTRPDDRADASGSFATRMYGMVNVNTAPFEVLRRLPFVASIKDTAGAVHSLDNANGTAAYYIIAYREGKKYGTHDYTARATGANVAGLRTASGSPGFLTPGEVAIPLADYATDLMGAQADPTKAGFLANRDAIYNSVANLIAVNSDVYAVMVAVQLRDASGNPRYTWNYMSVLDRSNVNLTKLYGDAGTIGAATWTDWPNAQAAIVNGTGAGQFKTVNNKADVTSGWTTAPDGTSRFLVVKMPANTDPATLMFTRLN